MLLSTLQQYPFFLSFIIGIIPALVWLWFWLKEDTHPEPAKMLTLSFIGGMIAVIVALPLQRIVYDTVADQNTSFVLWAIIEELAKFVIVYYIALSRKVTDEPVDNIIYLIVSALGFVALENALFLVDMVHTGDFAGIIMTSNLRFMGASLLHTLSSATIGICMALSFYRSIWFKQMYLLIGIVFAILLHTSFNLFIIKQAEGSVFLVFGAVWFAIIIVMLFFERVKRIHKPI